MASSVHILTIGNTNYDLRKVVSVADSVVHPLYAYIRFVDAYDAPVELLKSVFDPAYQASLDAQLQVLLRTVPPTAIDDLDDGYRPGLHWIDTVGQEEYVLIDATPGAAIWLSTTAGGGGGGGVGGSGVAGRYAYWVNSSTLTSREPIEPDIKPISATLTYDGQGRVSTVTTASGTRTMTYDGSGKLTNIAGTGAYKNKALGYTSDVLTSITVS